VVDAGEPLAEISKYSKNMEKSLVYDELREVRNCHEAFLRWGVGAGLLYTGIAAHVMRGRELWTLPVPVGNGPTRRIPTRLGPPRTTSRSIIQSSMEC